MSNNQSLNEALKIYPKEVILMDGTGVTLRPVQRADEPALLEMFGRLSKDDLWFLDHDMSDPDLIADWSRHQDVKRIISIIALLEGEIIGNAALIREKYGSKSHIGQVKITVDPSFRDKRLGTWMLFELVNLAMALDLRMVVMQLVQDRDSSIVNSAKRLDFVEEAVLKDYLMGREGLSHSLVIMTKRLPANCQSY